MRALKCWNTCVCNKFLKKNEIGVDFFFKKKIFFFFNFESIKMETSSEQLKIELPSITDQNSFEIKDSFCVSDFLHNVALKNVKSTDNAENWAQSSLASSSSSSSPLSSSSSSSYEDLATKNSSSQKKSFVIKAGRSAAQMIDYMHDKNDVPLIVQNKPAANSDSVVRQFKFRPREQPGVVLVGSESTEKRRQKLIHATCNPMHDLLCILPVGNQSSENGTRRQNHCLETKHALATSKTIDIDDVAQKLIPVFDLAEINTQSTTFLASADQLCDSSLNNVASENSLLNSLIITALSSSIFVISPRIVKYAIDAAISHWYQRAKVTRTSAQVLKQNYFCTIVSEESLEALKVDQNKKCNTMISSADRHSYFWNCVSETLKRALAGVFNPDVATQLLPKADDVGFDFLNTAMHCAPFQNYSLFENTSNVDSSSDDKKSENICVPERLAMTGSDADWIDLLRHLVALHKSQAQFARIQVWLASVFWMLLRLVRQNIDGTKNKEHVTQMARFAKWEEFHVEAKYRNLEDNAVQNMFFWCTKDKQTVGGLACLLFPETLDALVCREKKVFDDPVFEKRFRPLENDFLEKFVCSRHKLKVSEFFALSATCTFRLQDKVGSSLTKLVSGFVGYNLFECDDGNLLQPVFATFAYERPEVCEAPVSDSLVQKNAEGMANILCLAPNSAALSMPRSEYAPRKFVNDQLTAVSLTAYVAGCADYFNLGSIVDTQLQKIDGIAKIRREKDKLDKAKVVNGKSQNDGKTDNKVYKVAADKDGGKTDDKVATENKTDDKVAADNKTNDKVATDKSEISIASAVDKIDKASKTRQKVQRSIAETQKKVADVTGKKLPQSWQSVAQKNAVQSEQNDDINSNAEKTFDKAVQKVVEKAVSAQVEVQRKMLSEKMEAQWQKKLDAQVQSHNKKQSKKLQSARQQLADAKKEAKNWQQKCNAKEKRIGVLEKQLALKKEKHQRQASDAQRDSQMVKNLKQKLSSLECSCQETVDGYEQKIADLQQTLVELKDILARKDAELAQVREALENEREINESSGDNSLVELKLDVQGNGSDIGGDKKNAITEKRQIQKTATETLSFSNDGSLSGSTCSSDCEEDSHDLDLSKEHALQKTCKDIVEKSEAGSKTHDSAGTKDTSNDNLPKSQQEHSATGKAMLPVHNVMFCQMPADWSYRDVNSQVAMSKKRLQLLNSIVALRKAERPLRGLNAQQKMQVLSAHTKGWYQMHYNNHTHRSAVHSKSLYGLFSAFTRSLLDFADKSVHKSNCLIIDQRVSPLLDTLGRRIMAQFQAMQMDCDQLCNNCATNQLQHFYYVPHFVSRDQTIVVRMVALCDNLQCVEKMKQSLAIKKSCCGLDIQLGLNNNVHIESTMLLGDTN